MGKWLVTGIRGGTAAVETQQECKKGFRPYRAPYLSDIVWHKLRTTLRSKTSSPKLEFILASRNVPTVNCTQIAAESFRLPDLQSILGTSSRFVTYRIEGIAVKISVEDLSLSLQTWVWLHFAR